MTEQETSDHTLMNTWIELLRETRWAFKPDYENDSIILIVSDTRNENAVVIHFYEKSKLVSARYIVHERCPKIYRSKMVDFITKENSKFSIGGFVMDPRDGEIQYRTSLDTESLTITPEFVDKTIKLIVHMGFELNDKVLNIMKGKNV